MARVVRAFSSRLPFHLPPITMTAQTQEELLAAHLEQQKIDNDEPVVEDDDDYGDDDKEDEAHSCRLKLPREQFKVPDLSHVTPKPEPSTVAQDGKEVDETGIAVISSEH